jgi:hypothetical protein
MAVVDVLDKFGDYLRVRLRFELMAFALQIAFNLFVIGQNAVVDYNKICKILDIKF